MHKPVSYTHLDVYKRQIFALESAVSQIMEYTRENSMNTHAVPNYIIENTIQYIVQNLAGNLSLDTIAQELHISPSHLSRTFKKATSCSLTEYINKERIHKAKELLHNTCLLYTSQRYRNKNTDSHNEHTVHEIFQNRCILKCRLIVIQVKTGWQGQCRGVHLCIRFKRPQKRPNDWCQ